MARGTGKSHSSLSPKKADKYLDPEALARLANIKLVARAVVEGFISGLHRSPYKGFSVEFAEYREYVPGDDLKHFDWKVFARSDKEYIRLYQEETNLRVYVLLDSSASMDYGSGELTKFDYGAYLAASLAYLAIRQQDSCGAIVFDDDIRYNIPPRSTPIHLTNMLTVFEKVKPTEKTNISGTLHKLAESLVKRGLIILISDLFDDPDAIMKGIHHFRHKRHEVILFHVMDPAEIDFPFEDMTEFRDLETSEKINVNPVSVREAYIEKVNEYIARFKHECAKSNVDYVLCNTEVPFEIMLAQYLAKRARI